MCTPIYVLTKWGKQTRMMLRPGKTNNTTGFSFTLSQCCPIKTRTDRRLPLTLCSDRQFHTQITTFFFIFPVLIQWISVHTMQGRCLKGKTLLFLFISTAPRHTQSDAHTHTHTHVPTNSYLLDSSPTAAGGGMVGCGRGVAPHLRTPGWWGMKEGTSTAHRPPHPALSGTSGSG